MDKTSNSSNVKNYVNGYIRSSNSLRVYVKALCKIWLFIDRVETKTKISCIFPLSFILSLVRGIIEKEIERYFELEIDYRKKTLFEKILAESSITKKDDNKKDGNNENDNSKINVNFWLCMLSKGSVNKNTTCNPERKDKKKYYYLIPVRKFRNTTSISNYISEMNLYDNIILLLFYQDNPSLDVILAYSHSNAKEFSDKYLDKDIIVKYLSMFANGRG